MYVPQEPDLDTDVMLCQDKEITVMDVLADDEDMMGGQEERRKDEKPREASSAGSLASLSNIDDLSSMI